MADFGQPSLYLITRQRAFSCGIDDIHGYAVIGMRNDALFIDSIGIQSGCGATIEKEYEAA